MLEPVILIPALNPDEKLARLLDDLANSAFASSSIVIVNDGSDVNHIKVFDEIKKRYQIVKILNHPDNLGKGAALKTGFNYVLENFPDTIGIATLDADGQHTISALESCIATFENHPNDLIIGVRTFTNEIPFRSQFGNVLTQKLVKTVTHQNISDTQTGLRVIPMGYVRKLVDFPGDRFQFEFDMLLQAKKYGIKIIEEPIPTVYIEGNKSSHFRVIRDSLSIYSRFFKFAMSGLISFVVDIAIFEMIILLMGNHVLNSIFIATVLSRLLSAVVNYMLNHRIVFERQGHNTLIKYGILFIFQMIASSLLTDGVTNLLTNSSTNNIAPMFAKMIVDFLLFMLSYNIQKRLIFNKREE